jgi:hypothetical protein
MDVHSFRRGPLAKPEQAAWCAASRLFRETPQNLADRVLQPADRGLQLAFRLVGAAFGLLLVRFVRPNRRLPEQTTAMAPKQFDGQGGIPPPPMSA